jgi:cysteinyl-tRNA synthetase
VYYDTSKFEGYAAFARLDLEDQETSERIAFNPEKRNQSDFALWKFSPKDSKRDMEWESPWGKGFPGWHIECSAMSMKYLGDTLDIHTGGIDHIPVHHTNEIAQSEAVTGKRFANYWMHGNHVMVDGEKISKSLGNGIRLQHLLSEGNTIEAIRLLILESHYRKQSKFSQATLTAAHNRLSAYQAMADLKWQTSPGGIEQDAITSAKNEIINAMQHDLSSPEALAILSKFEQEATMNGVAPESRDIFQDLLETIDNLFGLNLSMRQDITPDQKTLLEERFEARQSKDWDRADSLRTTLQEQGIEVRDVTNGQVWAIVA